jgi:uncharacterized protein (TIGR03437 family)
MRPFGALIVLTSAAAFAQTPTVTSVYNVSSYSTTLCPGLLAIVTGTNFGTTNTNTTVMVGGKPAYVFPPSFFYTATEFAVEIPFELAPGQWTLTVTVGGSSSTAFPVTLAAASPAIETPFQNPASSGVIYDAKGNAITIANPAQPGATLILYAVGLGATSPATPTGAPAAANQLSPLPTLTIGGVKATVLSAGTTANGGGLYQVNFTVPTTGNLQGTVPIVITVGNTSSVNTTTIPLVGLTGVVVNGSFASPGTIAPGSIATIFANNLGSASTNELSGLFPATQSEGVQVTFNGTAAPMFHLVPSNGANAQQIDLFVPNNLPTTGTVNVQLTTSSANYPNYTLNIVPALPSMFRFVDPKTSNQYAIAQFANSAWVVLPTATATNIGFPLCTSSTTALTECGEPANIGDYLVIYLTGLGLATVNGSPNGATLPNGQNPPLSGNPIYETPTLPTVTIGGVATTVLFSGLVPGNAGEYQIDVQVPPGVTSGDNIPVMITMMGQSDTANISIQPSRVAPPQ